MADSNLRYSALKKDAKVLVVGAGRISCEVLKTLALSGCQQIHIIDKDLVEVSDLDGQFLFRQSHVGKTKVVRKAVLNFRPDITITSFHGDVRDPEFDVNFFKQFNVVVNGLDNFDVGRHVNRLCLAADVSLIASWTTGFHGQVAVHVKGITEYYECQPKPALETYPVSTITRTPSEFVHCIVWAKDFPFAKLFEDKSRADVRLSDGASSSVPAEDVLYRRKDEDIEQHGRRIYDHVFGHNIEVALSNVEIWKNCCKPKPLYSKDVLPNDVSRQNGDVGIDDATSDPLSVPAMDSLGLQNPQAVLSLMENSRVFLEALKRLFMKREKETGYKTFNKHDQLAVVFVTAAANIRGSAFGIPVHSLFEAKGIVGNIVPTVATTNAIIAGLIVIETVKMLQNDKKNYRIRCCSCRWFHLNLTSLAISVRSHHYH